jgi:hypothetical protein
MEARLFSSPVQTPNILMSLRYFSPIMHTTVLKIPGVVNSHMNQTLHHHRCKLSTHAAPCFSFIFFFGSRRSSKRWADGKGEQESENEETQASCEPNEPSRPSVHPRGHTTPPLCCFPSLPRIVADRTIQPSPSSNGPPPHPTPRAGTFRGRSPSLPPPAFNSPRLRYRLPPIASLPPAAMRSRCFVEQGRPPMPGVVI